MMSSCPSQDIKRQKIMDEEEPTACAKLEEIEKFVYKLGVNGSCDFEDGQSIAVNRGALAFNCAFFRNAFFGPEPKTNIKIDGFDRATFKVFLDCLLGLKEYTLLVALIIYPIAKKYEVKESLEKCVAALKPEVMNENVSLVLNLSAFYENDDLTDYVINFIKKEYGIFNFLENAEYSSCLEPLAMRKLIENVNLNSLIWTLVYQWGEKYLKKRDMTDVKTFFMENGILEKILTSDFESATSLIDFHENSCKQLLSSDQILIHLRANVLEGEKKLPDNSIWVKIDAGYSLKETIVFKNVFCVYLREIKQDLDLFIASNYILFEPEESISVGLKAKARYMFRHIKHRKTTPKPYPIWRDDLNFFYREKLTANSPEDYRSSALYQSDEFDLDLVHTKSKKPFCNFVMNFEKFSEIHSVEVTYNFNSPCRILKASLDPYKYLIQEKNLYFTRIAFIENQFETEDEDEVEYEDEDKDKGKE